MRVVAGVLATALLLLAPSRAAADSFEIVTGGLGALGGPTILTPFNHTLGTLDSVDVSIVGGVSATILTQVNDAPFPIPTPFSVGLDQNFLGIGGLFNFFQPGTFVFTGTGSGAGETQTFNQFFDYEFTFDSLSNLVGFTSVGSVGPLVPPIQAFGNFADFTDTTFPVMQEFEVLQPSTTWASFGGSLVTWSNQGDYRITYNYTPAPADEPSIVLLLVAGFLGLAIGAARFGMAPSATVS